jgi:hypothetical protein
LDDWIKDVGIVGIFALLVIRVILDRLLPWVRSRPSDTAGRPVRESGQHQAITLDEQAWRNSLEAKVRRVLERLDELDRARDERRQIHTELLRISERLKGRP